jgi:DnaJ-class molecular chaperone
MVRVPTATRWRYIVECQDLESGRVFVSLGSADTREECEGCASHEADHQRDLFRHVVNIEACELCRECDGEGTLVTSKSGTCSACKGHRGSFTKIRFSLHPRSSFPLSHSKAA